MLACHILNSAELRLDSFLMPALSGVLQRPLAREREIDSVSRAIDAINRNSHDVAQPKCFAGARAD
jgi:hypothetical protein